MLTWSAVVLAGLGSYLFRLVPLIVGEKLILSARVQAVLRHAGMGAISALLVFGIVGTAGRGGTPALVSVVVAVSVSSVVAFRGRSLALALIAGIVVQLGAGFLIGL